MKLPPPDFAVRWEPPPAGTVLPRPRFEVGPVTRHDINPENPPHFTEDPDDDES